MSQLSNLKMKKGVIIFLLIFISALLIFSLDYFSGEINNFGNQTTPKDTTVIGFEKQCDTLAMNVWNKRKYHSIKDKLQVFKTVVITATDASAVENYLQLAYAKSLVNSFNQWCQNNCTASVDSLNAEMIKVSNFSECKSILSKPLNIINNYNMALKFPGTVNYLLRLEFDNQKFNNIVTSINTSCNISEIKNCDIIKSIKFKQLAELNNFKKFVTDFNQAFYLFNQGREKETYCQPLKLLCPINDPRANQYYYYLHEINSFGICPAY